MKNDLKIKNINNKTIDIIPEFKEHIFEMEKIDRTKTSYAQKIRAILETERKKNDQAITLKKIQKSYENDYKKISLTTISRILRNHMKLHYIKIKPKNPKLKINNYRLMHNIFLKVISKANKEGYNIIYIDETGCYLENNNYRDWAGKDEQILKGPENKVKDKINIIAGINILKLIHYKIVHSSVNSTIFSDFIKELNTKLTDEEKKKSLIVLDNATYHKTKEVINTCLTNKFKVITNIPYNPKIKGIDYFL